LISPGAKLLAAPAAAPIVWLGTLAALAGQLPATGVLVGLLDALAAFPLGFVGWVAHAAASTPHATAAVALGGRIAVVGADPADPAPGAVALGRRRVRARRRPPVGSRRGPTLPRPVIWRASRARTISPGQ